MKALSLAFVSGLSGKKLAQKLAPLQALPQVRRIDLYRRQPFYGYKVQWMSMPRFCSRMAPFGDLWRFAKLFQNAPRYDLIVGCHQFFHGVYAAIAGLLRGIPVVQLTIKDPVRIQKSPLADWALRHADGIGFRGHISLNRFRKRCGKDRLFFVPQNVWHPSTQLKQNAKSIDLLYVGNFARDKNIPGWLETAAEVKRRMGNITAVLVGEQPNRRIAAKVHKLNLSGDVRFTGPLYNNALHEQYTNARVFLLTSRWEGLPMAALEAMAAGIPVVATDIGDIRDLVNHGESGYLVPVGDVIQAARAVKKLLADDTLYLHMSQKARESATAILSESTLEYVTEQWRIVLVRMGLIASRKDI